MWELRGGDAHEAFKHIEATPREKLEWGKAYLEAEQAAGFDRTDALTALEAEGEILDIDEKIEMQRAREAAHERERVRARERGHELEH